MRSAYERSADECRLLCRVRQLSAKTVIFDVEPLVASWGSDQEALDHGVALALDQVAAIAGVLAVCFATNSARHPSAIPDIPAIQVVYLASARKPLRTRPYQHLPRPGVVIGDQVVTDGILARRLGYAFLHYRPPAHAVPLGPLLLSGLGQLVRPIVFARQH